MLVTTKQNLIFEGEARPLEWSTKWGHTILSFAKFYRRAYAIKFKNLVHSVSTKQILFFEYLRARVGSWHGTPNGYLP